jgi:toxin YoeB
MRNIAFEQGAFGQFNAWAKEDKKIYGKIVKLIDDLLGDPFSGIGKPEPLKYDLAGCWSRRITDEHRLVYRVTDDEIVILSCKYHYDE